jgi:TolB-like protein
MDTVMNAQIESSCDSAAAPVPDAVWPAVRQLLDSPVFARAPRMCHLLSFLVDKKLTGREHEISEYAIGLDVFRRDARLYDTTLDPVVRVQIGRLRGRLAAYYAGMGALPSVRIALPLGSYIPAISHACATATASPLARARALELAPLRDLTCRPESNAFVAGVDDELGSRLFNAFGALVQLRDERLAPPAGGNADVRPAHRLEGSIRVERNHVRASMRLVDTGAGHVAWLSQFDCSGELGMHLQEELAGAICDKLQRYLADD